MKAPYLALLVSYFALSVSAQDSTAYIISGTGTVDPGESTPVPSVPGNGDSPDPNGHLPPNQFYPPLASQGYSSNKLEDGVNYNSVGPAGIYPNPYQTSNADQDQNMDPNQSVDPNQSLDPYPTGIPPPGVPPQGTEDATVVPQPSGPGYGDHNESLESLASEALASSSSALQGGWTPGTPSATPAPPDASGNASSGRAGSNGYITTTLAIAIPIPLNASDYDPNVTARIIKQFGGAANVRTSVLAVVFGVVGAVAGAVML